MNKKLNQNDNVIKIHQEVKEMTQKELLSYAMVGINKKMDREQEIIDDQVARTGEANPYTEARLEKLWKHFYELLEMEKELEDREEVKER